MFDLHIGNLRSTECLQKTRQSQKLLADADCGLFECRNNTRMAEPTGDGRIGIGGVGANAHMGIYIKPSTLFAPLNQSDAA